MLDVPTGGADPSVLGFAEVSDRGSLEAELKKSKDTVAAGTHGGFDVFKQSGRLGRRRDLRRHALIGNSEAVVDAAIDRLAGTGDKLSDSSDFKDTLASLPSDNIVVGYAPGDACCSSSSPWGSRRALRSPQGVQGTQLARSPRRSSSIRGLGLSLDATDNGLRMRSTRCSTARIRTWASRTRRRCSATCPRARGSRRPSAASAAARPPRPRSRSRPIPPRSLQSRRLELGLGIKLDDLYALLLG